MTKIIGRIKEEEYRVNILPREELNSIWKFSPINLPSEKTVFSVWHGVEFGDAQGTIYSLRLDIGHLNFDVYSINSINSVRERGVIVIRKAPISEYQGYHQIEKYEDIGNAPQYIRDNREINDKIKNFFEV